MLHLLHLYHLKFGLPVSLHIENHCLKNVVLLHLYLLEHGICFGYEISPIMIAIQDGYDKNFHIECIEYYDT